MPASRGLTSRPGERETTPLRWRWQWRNPSLGVSATPTGLRISGHTRAGPNGPLLEAPCRAGILDRALPEQIRPVAAALCGPVHVYWDLDNMPCSGNPGAVAEQVAALQAALGCCGLPAPASWTLAMNPSTTSRLGSAIDLWRTTQPSRQARGRAPERPRVRVFHTAERVQSADVALASAILEDFRGLSDGALNEPPPAGTERQKGRHGVCVLVSRDTGLGRTLAAVRRPHILTVSIADHRRVPSRAETHPDPYKLRESDWAVGTDVTIVVARKEGQRMQLAAIVGGRWGTAEGRTVENPCGWRIPTGGEQERRTEASSVWEPLNSCCPEAPC